MYGFNNTVTNPLVTTSTSSTVMSSTVSSTTTSSAVASTTTSVSPQATNNAAAASIVSSSSSSPSSTPTTTSAAAVSSAPSVTSVSSSSSSSTTTSTTSSAIAVSTVPSWSFYGCWTDNVGSRSLMNQIYGNADIMTQEICMSQCKTAGYTMAGLEYYSECYCDTQIRNGGVLATDPTTCNTACKVSFATVIKIFFCNG